MKIPQKPPKEQKQPLSKAQKERQKREEEERKRIEEEEARLRAEQEEKDRLKREKEEIEKKKKQEKNELTKRVQELDDLREIQTSAQRKIREILNRKRHQERWSRYMLCDGSPDPTIPQEINTFLNLWREDESRVMIQDVLIDSELCLKLINELEYRINDLEPDEEKVNEKVLQYGESMRDLMGLLRMKMERACHEMLLRGTVMKDPETLNFQRTWRNTEIRLCLWGNLSFQPKIRSFHFPEDGVTFDIPKYLQQKECAYEILFTRFDHFSPLAKSYFPRRHQEEIIEAPEPPLPEPLDLNAVIQEEVPADEPIENIAEKSMDLLAELSKADAGDNSEAEVEIVEEEVDPPPEDRVETPKPLEYDDFDGEEDVLDLREYHSLGGTFTFNILVLPPQSQSRGNWHMYQLVKPPKVVPFAYDADEFPENKLNENLGTHDSLSADHVSEGDKSKPAKTTAAKEQEKKDEKPPIGVTIRIPDDVNFCDKPVLARWDDSILEWRTQGILLREYKETEKLLSFQTRVFGTMAMFQEIHINMPFQSWELRPYHTLNDLIEIHEPLEEVELLKTSRNESRRTSGVEIPYRASSRLTVLETMQALDVIDPDGTLGKNVGGTKSRLPSSKITSFTEAPKPIPKYELGNANHCILTIIAAVNEVKIEIRGKKVAIVEDFNKPDLNHLAGKWYSVGELKKLMRDGGVNIFPQEDSTKYVSIANKNSKQQAHHVNPIAEERLYEQMAMLSSSVAFSWSRWNAECGQDDKIIVQACEHLDGTKNVDEEAWKLFAVTRKKVEKLKLTEFEQEYSEEVDDMTTFHADFYHMYEEIGQQEGIQRVKQADCEFIETVKELLKTVRCVSFS